MDLVSDAVRAARKYYAGETSRIEHARQTLQSQPTSPRPRSYAIAYGISGPRPTAAAAPRAESIVEVKPEPSAPRPQPTPETPMADVKIFEAPGVRVKVPMEVIRGEVSLPIYDVYQEGVIIPTPKKRARPVFRPRPKQPGAPIKKETAEFVTKEEAIKIKETQEEKQLRRIAEPVIALEKPVEVGAEIYSYTKPGRVIKKFLGIPDPVVEFEKGVFSGAALAIPSLPAAIYSVVTKPIETGVSMAEEAALRPTRFAGEMVGAGFVLGKIPIRSAKPRVSLSVETGVSKRIKIPTRRVEIPLVEKGKKVGVVLKQTLEQQVGKIDSDILIVAGKKRFAARGRTYYELPKKPFDVTRGITEIEAAELKPRRIKGEMIVEEPVGVPERAIAITETKPVVIKPTLEMGEFIGKVKTPKEIEAFYGRYIAKTKKDVAHIISVSKTESKMSELSLAKIKKAKPKPPEALKIKKAPSRIAQRVADVESVHKVAISEITKKIPKIKKAVIKEKARAKRITAAKRAAATMPGLVSIPAAAELEYDYGYEVSPKQAEIVLRKETLAERREVGFKSAVKQAGKMEEVLAQEYRQISRGAQKEMRVPRMDEMLLPKLETSTKLEQELGIKQQVRTRAFMREMGRPFTRPRAAPRSMFIPLPAVPKMKVKAKKKEKRKFGFGYKEIEHELPLIFKKNRK